MSPLLATSRTDVASARDAAQRVVRTHERLAAYLRPGQTLADIDRFVAQTLEDLGCRSCFLGYRVARSPAFPSHACLSVNDCVVHGTAASHTAPMKQGDLLKIDIGVFYRGWVGDAAWTYVFGEPAPEVARLMECGKAALRAGIAALTVGGPYINWARAVQTLVESPPPIGYGFHLIRGLGGHGYGRKLHGPPFVSNVMPPPQNPGDWPDAYKPALPGTLLALEPMIAIGTGETVQRQREWPVRTKDGSLAVHYEHDVLISEHGPEVLTTGMEDLRDIIA